MYLIDLAGDGSGSWKILKVKRGESKGDAQYQPPKTSEDVETLIVVLKSTSQTLPFQKSLFVCLSVCLIVCLFVCLFVCQFVCLSVCSFVCLFVC